MQWTPQRPPRPTLFLSVCQRVTLFFCLLELGPFYARYARLPPSPHASFPYMPARHLVLPSPSRLPLFLTNLSTRACPCIDLPPSPARTPAIQVTITPTPRNRHRLCLSLSLLLFSLHTEDERRRPSIHGKPGRKARRAPAAQRHALQGPEEGGRHGFHEIAERVGRVLGALPRHPDKWKGLRQLHGSRPPHHIRTEPGDQGMDRGPPVHGGGRGVGGVLAARSRVRHARRGWGYSTECGSRFQDPPAEGAAGWQGGCGRSQKT
ncbi:FK506-binding protein 1-like protein [Leishmania tarentolae]|uniref:FK506-binding protein 1-like protein n=1 Tax=Leishmania tarentolae TaxID=5689 RepID=A0A640KA09_LEITA|nr:FK506-binding protein 1-like protein [Leishmania tarentolae]